MKIVKFKITGKRPLLMHSDVHADPLNPLTKAHKQLNAKRKKTDEDIEAIAKSEWRGAMYFDSDQGPYIPGVMVEASIISGAKLSRLGAQLKRSVEVVNDTCKLEYEGPRNLEGLWDAGFYDARAVKVAQSRVIRYRPIFKKWSAEVDIAYDEETIDFSDLKKCFEDAGLYCGIGDYRPKFGRYDVEVA